METNLKIPQKAFTSALGFRSVPDEQMNALYSSFPASLLSSIVIAIILSTSHWKVIGQAEIIHWNLLLGGALLARLILWLFWLNVQQLYSSQFWLNAFRVTTWITGMAWGYSAILLFAEDPIYQALLAFALAGVASGSMASLTVDKFTAVGFVVLTIIPFSYQIYMEHGTTSIAMSSMCVLFVIFVLLSSARARRNLEEQYIKNQCLFELSNEICAQQILEKIINTAQSIYINNNDINAALEHILRESMTLTKSELGFIGRIDKDNDATEFMTALVFASARTNKDFVQFLKHHLPENGEFRNLDNLFGNAIKTAKPIISHQLTRDMRTGELPAGHPAINNFIAIPVLNGKKVVALIGLANTDEEYSEKTAESIKPLLETVAQFVQNMNHEQRHAQDKAALEASNQHTQTILNDIADGVITINKHGIIQSFNHAAETIFGYRATQIIHKNISALMPEPWGSQHDQYMRKHLKTGKKTILGIGREVQGLRRNGEVFPMDLMVSRVFQQGEPLFIGIIRDITEKKRIDNLRNEWLTSVNKAIETPLTMITESLALLQDTNNQDLPDAQRKLIAVAENNSSLLKNLMKDFMDHENPLAASLPTASTTINIMTLVDTSITKNQPFAELHDKTISLKKRADHVEITVNTSQVEYILSQLLQGMIKIANHQKMINIKVIEDQTSAKIKLFIGRDSATDTRSETTKTRDEVINYLKNANTHFSSLGMIDDICNHMHGFIDYQQPHDKDLAFIIEFPLTKTNVF